MRVAILVLFMFSLGGWGQQAQPNAGFIQPEPPPHVGRVAPLIHYWLDLTHPGSHLAEVGILFAADAPDTDFQMPAWYPGRYSIYNYAVNAQQPAARCQAGADPSGADPALPFERLDPNTWRVHNGACRRVRFDYRVYGNTPMNGSFFQLDDTHANLNGGPVFMYVVGHKPDPVALDIRAPAGWRVLNELGQLGQTALRFPNYDVFIDAPTEAGPDFTLDSFRADGKTYRVMIHDYLTAAANQENKVALLAGLQKIVAYENTIVAPDELDTYTFFFTFDPQSSDGMEHLFGTQIMVPAGLGTEAGLQGALSAAAHEFFHQWNIKRIRPAALGPWDYTRPDPTPSLWVGEGFTQYYGDIALERAGLESAGDYLARLGRSLGSSLNGAAYQLMSAEESSLTAWFHDATPLEQETNQAVTTISYYARGEQIAAVLDLDLRRRTGGKKSLNDVLLWLWDNTYHAPRATYYLSGRGYTDADVRQAIEAAGGASYEQFFADYVAGTKPIPYDQYLEAAGLRLQCAAAAGARNYTGLRLDGDTVSAVDPGSPAEAAGFGADDAVVSVNGAAAGSIADLPAGRAANVVVTSHAKTLPLTLTPEAARPTACRLVDLPRITAAQRALRAQWLGGGSTQ